jgi:hypothetical protein
MVPMPQVKDDEIVGASTPLEVRGAQRTAEPGNLGNRTGLEAVQDLDRDWRTFPGGVIYGAQLLLI